MTLNSDLVLQRLDEISDKIGDVEKHQAVLNNDVAHHIRRTELLEEHQKQVQDEFRFIRDHVVTVQRLFRVAMIAWGALGTAVVVLTFIFQILDKK